AAAIDLEARRRRLRARPVLAAFVELGALGAAEEAQAVFPQVARVEVGPQAEHLLEVVRADLDARLAHLVARIGERPDLALDHHHAPLGEALPELETQRQPGQPAATDHHVPRLSPHRAVT